MADPRIEKLADLMVNYSLELKKGERALVRANSTTLPLATEVYRAIITAGGHPFMLWEEPVFNEILLREGSDDQIKYIHAPHQLTYETYDCMIALIGSENTRYLNNIDAAKQRVQREAKGPLSKTYMERSAKGDLRWVLTLFPTQAHAQDADMSLSEFEDFVYSACHVDKEDPVKEWRALSAMQQKLVDYLVGKKEVRVQGPNAELTLSIEGRSFINSDGHKNMPSGEIFTGPVEESVNGWIRYTYPAIYSGREVEGIELRFENGKVVDATAKKNEAFLISVLDTDPGARYLGEFAIGTNNGIQQFTKSILFDEKIGGTIHLAVGAGYPETGSKNKSAVHWDMICDMKAGGQIFVDGELFYDSGQFLVL